MDNGLFQICDFQQILCIIYLKSIFNNNAVMHLDIKAVTYLLKCLLAPE